LAQFSLGLVEEHSDRLLIARTSADSGIDGSVAVSTQWPMSGWKALRQREEGSHREGALRSCLMKTFIVHSVSQWRHAQVSKVGVLCTQ
jgi:hypothetical protein